MPGRLKSSPWILLGLLCPGSLACVPTVDKGRDPSFYEDAAVSDSPGADAGRPPDGPAPDRAVSPDLPRPASVADAPIADAAPVPPAPEAGSGTVNMTMGLISRWKLDEASGESTADSAGNNAGTLNGPVRMAEGFPGAKYPNSGSLVFDGEDDFVELGTANLPANNRPQSVSFWFSITAMPTDPQICVSLTDGLDGGSRLKLGFRDNQVAAWKSGSGTMVTGPAVASGWHHYAYTFDGTNHTLYVDGKQVGTSAVAPDTGAVGKARMGAGHNNAENFAGQLDEVRVYGRALTPVEVTALREGLE